MNKFAYLFQATVVSCWWLLIWVSDQAFMAFQFPGIGQLAFRSFLLPDIIIIVVLSLLHAYRPGPPWPT